MVLREGRWVALWVLAMTLLVACGGGDPQAQTCDEPSPGTVQLCLDATADTQATGALVIGGNRIDGLYAGSEWQQEDGAVAHGDPMLPLVDDFQMADVAPEERILVSGDAASVELTIGPLGADAKGYLSPERGDAVRVSEGAAELSLTPGDYLLTAEGNWDEGQQRFWFGLRVAD